MAWTTDYWEILKRSDINAEAVTLPHDLHESVCVAAAAAGKQIVMERPLAITVAECDHMIAACEKTGVTLATCYQGRFDLLPQKLHAELQA